MTTLQQKITQKFIENLTQQKILDSEKINLLKNLMTSNKKLKSEEFIKIFSTPAGSSLE